MMASLVDHDNVRSSFLAASKRALELEPASAASDQVLAIGGRFKAVIARTPARLDQAFDLRYRVFADELGARLDSADELDRDEFDPFCKHLVVVDSLSDEVVGTYRLLTPRGANRCGGRYIEREFDITPLSPILGDVVELGRACVDPNYRSGIVIMLLWSGIGQFMRRCAYRYLLGCASVPIQSEPHETAALYGSMHRQGLVSSQWRIDPIRPLDVSDRLQTSTTKLPSLFKAYIKAGGEVIGRPSHDPRFACLDFPVMLDLGHLNTRYDRRFVAS